MGRYYGKGSVVKFSKAHFVVDWRIGFHCNSGGVEDSCCTTYCSAASPDIGSSGSVPINDILAYVQPEQQDHIYACGYAFQDMTQDTLNKYATMFKMSTDGDVQYIRRWGEWESDTSSTDVSADVCRSITYDEGNRQVILLLEVRSLNLRPSSNIYSTQSGK
jgi:hypothetical protein